MQRGKPRGAEAKGRAKAAVGAAAAGAPADHRRRYGAAVEKGPAVWRQEWSHFMSNVRRTAEGTAVNLRADRDFGDGSQGQTFSYLFHSNTAAKEGRKEGRREREREREREKRGPKRGREDSGGEPAVGESRMRALTRDAEARGADFAGMNRKERRAAVSAAAAAAEAAEVAVDAARQVRPHELMDAKLQWYQQGPPPLDEVAERLVVRKALKHGRRLGLRYNYLAPHPSWVAARATKRRERVLITMGTKLAFPNDGDGDNGAAAAVGSSFVAPMPELDRWAAWAAARDDARAALLREASLAAAVELGGAGAAAGVVRGTKDEDKARVKIKAKAKANVKVNEKVKEKTREKTKDMTNVKVKAKAKDRANVKAKTEPKVNAGANVRAVSDTNAAAKVKTKVKAEMKAETKKTDRTERAANRRAEGGEMACGARGARLGRGGGVTGGTAGSPAEPRLGRGGRETGETEGGPAGRAAGDGKNMSRAERRLSRVAHFKEQKALEGTANVAAAVIRPSGTSMVPSGTSPTAGAVGDGGGTPPGEGAD